jgi:hypothetical protein
LAWQLEGSSKARTRPLSQPQVLYLILSPGPMPPRPFPYPIHIGIDICHVPRIAKIICAETPAGILIPNRDKFYRFTQKLFTPYEQSLLKTRFPGVHDEIASLNEANVSQYRPKLSKLSEYLAGRYVRFLRFTSPPPIAQIARLTISLE